LSVTRRKWKRSGNAFSLERIERQSKKAPSGRREMLMAIPGKGDGKKAAAKEPKKSRPARARKAG
jgi:hypothetical protein